MLHSNMLHPNTLHSNTFHLAWLDLGTWWRALFSRSGFTDEVLALSHVPDERLLLFSPDDLYAPGIVKSVADG